MSLRKQVPVVDPVLSSDHRYHRNVFTCALVSSLWHLGTGHQISSARCRTMLAWIVNSPFDSPSTRDRSKRWTRSVSLRAVRPAWLPEIISVCQPDQNVYPRRHVSLRRSPTCVKPTTIPRLTKAFFPKRSDRSGTTFVFEGLGCC